MGAPPTARLREADLRVLVTRPSLEATATALDRLIEDGGCAIAVNPPDGAEETAGIAEGAERTPKSVVWGAAEAADANTAIAEPVKTRFIGDPRTRC